MGTKGTELKGDIRRGDTRSVGETFIAFVIFILPRVIIRIITYSYKNTDYDQLVKES